MLVSLLSLAFIVIPPVPGQVVQRFVAPACERCSGHRGITIETKVGHIVVASVSGNVVFAGNVGGHLYLVQEPRPGVKVTYGWLDSIHSDLTHITSEASSHRFVPQAGEIGRAGSRTYLGVRVAGKYVEPLRFLGLMGSRLIGKGGVIVGSRTPSR